MNFLWRNFITSQLTKGKYYYFYSLSICVYIHHIMTIYVYIFLDTVLPTQWLAMKQSCQKLENK